MAGTSSVFPITLMVTTLFHVLQDYAANSKQGNVDYQTYSDAVGFLDV
jgi:hypothetical protein